MIGIKLGPCLAAIAKGEVDARKVEKIYSGTVATNSEAFVMLAEQLAREYCKEASRKAQDVFWELLNAGKIIQQRLINGQCPDCKEHKDIWVRSESDIIWQNLPIARQYLYDVYND